MLGRHRGLHFATGGGQVGEQVAEDNVADAEADGGQVNFAVAEVGEQAIESSASGDGTAVLAAVENFENETGVISEAAHDAQVELAEVVESAGGEVGLQGGEEVGAGRGDESFDIGEAEAEGSEFFLEHVAGFAFEFVDDGERFAGLGFVGHALGGEEFHPGAAVADADDDVIRGEAEGAQGFDEEGKKLGVGGGRVVADEVAVELEEFAEASALLFFVAEERGDAEPLDRFAVFARFGDEHAGYGRGHFRSQGDFALAFVGEGKKLPEDFAPAVLFAVEVEGFEGGSVVFAEAEGAGHAAPGAGEVVAAGAFGREEVAEAGQGLHDAGHSSTKAMRGRVFSGSVFSFQREEPQTKVSLAAKRHRRIFFSLGITAH